MLISDIFHALTGLILVAKSQKAIDAFSDSEAVEEEYTALVNGEILDTTEFDTPMVDSQRVTTIVSPYAPPSRSKRAQWITGVLLTSKGLKRHRVNSASTVIPHLVFSTFYLS